MDIFDGRYYKISQWLLLQTGLWPYQDQAQRFTRLVITYLLVASWVIPQVIIWIEEWGKDVAITFENFGILVFVSAAMTKYTATYMGCLAMESLLLRIARDWCNIHRRLEKDIVIEYNENALKLVLFYTAYLFFAWLSYSAMPLLPYTLDILLPQNTSRPILMPFFGDYIFFNQRDHHTFACLHVTFVTFAFFLIFAGIDGIYVLTVSHTCALFAVTCARLNLKLGTGGSDVIHINNDTEVQRRLIKAIALHNQALRCVHEVEEAFSRSFLVIPLTSIVQLPLGAVYILYHCDDVLRRFRIIALYIGIVIHLFYFNFIGQKLIDNSEEIFSAAYFCEWYFMSTKAQRMIHLILCRSRKPCQLTAGKVVVLSMESFGKIMKSVVSCFTVFSSIQ